MHVLESAVRKCDLGKLAHIQTVQSSLRQLIIDGNSKNWNPQLFRYAGIMDQPMPVYTIPPTDTKLPVPADFDASEAPCTWPGLAVERLVDLQTWMGWTLVQVGEKELSAKELVLRVASSDGGGHFDADRYTWLDDMDECTGPDSSRGVMAVRPGLA